jgi:molybdopterin converting factor small subunit
MNIRVKYFASIREAVGQGSETLQTMRPRWRAARRCAWRSTR